MAKKRNAAAMEKKREMAEKRRKVGDTIAVAVAIVALVAVIGLIIYSYTR